MHAITWAKFILANGNVTVSHQQIVKQDGHEDQEDDPQYIGHWWERDLLYHVTFLISTSYQVEDSIIVECTGGIANCAQKRSSRRGERRTL